MSDCRIHLGRPQNHDHQPARAFALDLNGQASAEWVAASLRYAAQEVASGRAGSETVLAKLSELLFVEAVRNYAENLPPERKGWFAALRDPAVGRALALMHARVAHDWTTDELARSQPVALRFCRALRPDRLMGMDNRSPPQG